MYSYEGKADFSSLHSSIQCYIRTHLSQSNSQETFPMESFLFPSFHKTFNSYQLLKSLNNYYTCIIIHTFEYI